MRDIERAYELGRAAERQKMADLASLMSNERLATLASAVTPAPTDNGARATRIVKAALARGSRKAIKAAVADKDAKAPRGVKKATRPRTKGVKEAIGKLIQNTVGGIATAAIIAETGFKESSVRATLMALKKSGVVTNYGKLWVTPQALGRDTGNSEGEHASA